MIDTRARRAVLRVVALLATALSLPATAVQQEAPDVDALAQEALRLLNDARRGAGLAELQADPALRLLAMRHSREQAERRRVSHHSVEFNLSTERRVRISFPDVPRLAENVARNRTLGRLHQGLLDSPDHRRNRLDPEFTHVGIGIAWDGQYALYFTEVFVTAAGGTLGEPLAYYYDAAPGSYEARENPRVENGGETIVIGPPGPDDPEHWTHVGIQAFVAGDLDEAETSFRKALELDPDYHYASYNLARVLIDAGALQEAVGLLDALIARDPDDLDAIATRGTAALFLQQYADAAELFRRVLRVRPDDADAWYNFGLSLELLDRRADAASAYREALSIDPGLRAAQAGLARLMRR